MDLLNVDTWKFINTFAPWLSAIGTITAVCVSLYFSRRDRRLRLEVTASYRYIPQNNQGYIHIRIINIGNRTAKITGIGWRVGVVGRYGAFDSLDKKLSDTIPVTLKDGEDVDYYIYNFETLCSYDPSKGVPDYYFGKNQFKSVARSMLGKYPRLEILFAKVFVDTTLGRVHN